MGKQQAEQIWDYYVGSYVSCDEFMEDGKLSESAIESQVEFAKEQGWVPGGTLDIDEDDLREAIKTLCE